MSDDTPVNLIEQIENLLAQVETPAALLDIASRANSLGTELNTKLKTEAINTALTALQSVGLTVNDLLADQALRVPEQPVQVATRVPRVPRVPRKIWRNPEDHNQVWRGFGRVPDWLKVAREKGYTEVELVLQNV